MKKETEGQRWAIDFATMLLTLVRKPSAVAMRGLYPPHRARGTEPRKRWQGKRA